MQNARLKIITNLLGYM